MKLDKSDASGAWVTVFQTLNLSQLQVAQSLLESQGIQARLLDDVMGRSFPVALAGIGRIQVRQSQAKQAKDLLAGISS